MHTSTSPNFLLGRPGFFALAKLRVLKHKYGTRHLHLGAALHVEMAALSALESLNDPAAASKLPCSKLHGSEHPSCAEGTAMEAED